MADAEVVAVVGELVVAGGADVAPRLAAPEPAALPAAAVWPVAPAAADAGAE